MIRPFKKRRRILRIQLNMDKRIRLFIIIATLLVIVVGSLTFYYLNTITERIYQIIDSDKEWLDKIEILNTKFQEFYPKPSSISEKEYLAYIILKSNTPGNASQKEQAQRFENILGIQSKLIEEMKVIAAEGRRYPRFEAHPRILFDDIEERLDKYKLVIQSLIDLQAYRYLKQEEAIALEIKRIEQKIKDEDNKLTRIHKDIVDLTESTNADKEFVLEELKRKESLSQDTKTGLTNQRFETLVKGVKTQLTDNEILQFFNEQFEVLKVTANEIKLKIETIYNDRNDAFEKHGGEVKGIVKNAMDSMLIILVIAIVIGLSLTFLAPRIATLPMKRLITLINDIKDGHYIISRKLETNDDIGILFRHLHSLIRTITELDSLKADLITVLEKRFKTVGDMYEPVIITNLKAEVYYVNAAFVDVLRIPANKLLHKKTETTELPDVLKKVIKVGCEDQEKTENAILYCREGNETEEMDDGNESGGKGKGKRYYINTYFIRNHQGDISEVMTILTSKKK